MIQIFINGEEVVSNKEFTIHEEMLNTSSTILNNCYPKSWETTKDYVNNFYFPPDYSKCEIYDNGNLIFAGVVKNSGNISLRPTDPKYCSLQILDYKTLLSEGECLDYVIPEGTIKEAVESVISKLGNYGFVKGQIKLENANEIIGAYSTYEQTPYDALQYLAEISGARWFTRLVNSSTNAIDFYTPAYLDEAPNIKYTQQYFEDKNIVDISFSFSGADYRNQQIVLSDQIFNTIDTTDRFVATSEQTIFRTSGIVGKLKEVYVNGVSQSIGTSGDKEKGKYADFYYTIGTDEVESSTNQPLGAEIRLVYTSLIKGRVSLSNEDEIVRISQQITRLGRISRYENRNDVSTAKELSHIAQNYLKYKGKPQITLKITTQDFDIFELGQQAYFDAPMNQLKDTYLVKSKDIQITKTGNDGIVFYVYELVNNFNTESDINFFDNQRRKTKGNIGEDEYITRNIDINEQATIYFENFNIVPNE